MRVAVTSRSFSKHPVLRKELLCRYPDAKFNDEGLSLTGDITGSDPSNILFLQKILPESGAKKVLECIF